jgi:hypothetical protein
VQTTHWGQPAGEGRVLPDSCGGKALHGSEVYVIGVGSRSGLALVGFLVIKKKKSLHTISNTQRACFSLPILLLSLDEWV